MSSTRSSSPSEASFASFSSFSSGLYVPVHKRGRSASGSSFTSAATSWRSRSPACSERSMCQEQESVVSHQEPEVVAEPSRIYSAEFLISLAESPLSRIAPETREALRANVPQIVMNRRQRKYNEFFYGMGLKDGAAKKEPVKEKVAAAKDGKKNATPASPSPKADANKPAKGRNGSNNSGNNRRSSNNKAQQTSKPVPKVSAAHLPSKPVMSVPVKAPTSFAAAAKAPTGPSANILAPVNGTSWRGRTVRGPSATATFSVRMPIATA